MGGEVDPAMQSRALAAALRGLRGQQAFGQIASIAGGPTEGKPYQQMAQEATTQGDQVLRQGMHGQELMARLAETRANREATQAYREDSLNQQNALRRLALDLQSRKRIANPETGGTSPAYGPQGPAQGPINTNTPSPGPVAPGPTPTDPLRNLQQPVAGDPAAVPPPPGGRQGKQLQTAATQMNRDLDAFARGSGLQQIGMTQNRAAKLKALIVDPQTGQLRDQITPQQMYEVTLALQQMVAQGQASEREVEALLPKSLWGDAVRIVQYFSGKPMDANQKGWAANILESAGREAGVSQDFLNEQFLKRIPANYSIIKKLHQPTLDAMLKSHGMDPAAFDETGNVRQGASPFIKNAAGGGGAKTIVKKQVNRQLGKTRVTYSDGSVEETDGIQ